MHRNKLRYNVYDKQWCCVTNKSTQRTAYRTISPEFNR